jgi:diadenosine tetraphosphate (Ap4A) HIT family hydrolase
MAQFDKVAACPLCESDGGLLVWSDRTLRIIQASEAGFPAFYRVIWNGHAVEFSDLDAAQRAVCMDAVTTVEKVLREQLAPTKVNLAAFGNVVPHLHWHVIARFDWDSHFPAPFWAPALRPSDVTRESQIAALCPEINRRIAERMSA